jgi:hypothetical protein
LLLCRFNCQCWHWPIKGCHYQIQAWQGSQGFTR